MTYLLSAVNDLSFNFGEYSPLIVVVAVLAALFVLFKVFGVTGKLLWKLLINAIIGAALLCLFDIVFVKYLHMDFFRIPITWVNVAVVGILGIPGLLLLLVLQFIL
jgi:inhibitor of the pro-sigma K processing machinery